MHESSNAKQNKTKSLRHLKIDLPNFGKAKLTKIHYDQKHFTEIVERLLMILNGY